MSEYTTEVRFICEMAAKRTSQGDYSTIAQAVVAGANEIFEDFPIFDESYRLALETKILRHYYLREIAFETVGVWKLYLNNRLNEIMPYYNQLYKSQLLEFNPFYDVDLTRDRKVQREGNQIGSSNDTQETQARTDTNDTSTGSSRTTGESLQNVRGDSSSGGSSTDTRSTTHYDLYSNTPQGSLTGVESQEYLTDARKITDNLNGRTSNLADSRTSTSTQGEDSSRTTTDAEAQGSARSTAETVGQSKTTLDVTNMEDYIEHVKGKQGMQSYASLLNEFRSTFLNIDMQIINELADLFFNLY